MCLPLWNVFAALHAKFLNLEQLCHDPTQSSEIGILKLILLVLSSDSENPEVTGHIPAMQVHLNEIDQKLDKLMNMMLAPHGEDAVQLGASLATAYEPRTPGNTNDSAGSTAGAWKTSLVSPRAGLYSRMQKKSHTSSRGDGDGVVETGTPTLRKDRGGGIVLVR